MATIYRYNKNPFSDLLLKSIIYGVDISDKNTKLEINNTFIYILKNVLENEQDTIHLDFEITNKDNYFKVIGKNAISALWLSGILPPNVSDTFKNPIILGNRKYIFNKKNKTLKYTIIND